MKSGDTVEIDGKPHTITDVKEITGGHQFIALRKQDCWNVNLDLRALTWTTIRVPPDGEFFKPEPFLNHVARGLNVYIPGHFNRQEALDRGKREIWEYLRSQPVKKVHPDLLEPHFYGEDEK